MQQDTPTPTEAEPTSVREKSVRSLLWVGSIHILRGVLFFSVPALLANMTGAAEIGMAEICLAVFAIASLFIELGTGPAIIRKPNLDQRFLSTVFFVNLLTGLVFCAGLFFGAPLLTRLLKTDARLIPFLRWIAISFIFFALAIVQRNLLARRLAFRRIALVNGVAVAAALSLIALGLFLRWQLEALIAGLFGFSVVASVGLWVAGRWRPSFDFDPRQLGPLFRFSLSVTAGSALDTVATQWERFLISGLLGPAELGLYSLARNLHRTPLRHLMQVSDTILLPGLSLIQGDKAGCRKYYTSALRYEFLLLGPLVVFVGLFAADLIAVFYGSRWNALAPLVYLTIPVTLRMITAHTVGAVFLSQGRADVQLRWVIYSILLMSAYTVIGRPWGIEGVAASVLVLGFLGWGVSHHMANRLLELRFRDFLRPLSLPVAAALLLTLAMWPVTVMLRSWLPGLPWARIGLGMLSVVALQVLILRSLSPRSLSGLFVIIRSAAGFGQD
jgi:O-antigen/teichoic acid export membrane protein